MHCVIGQINGSELSKISVFASATINVSLNVKLIGYTYFNARLSKHGGACCWMMFIFFSRLCAGLSHLTHKLMVYPVLIEVIGNTISYELFGI